MSSADLSAFVAAVSLLLASLVGVRAEEISTDLKPPPLNSIDSDFKQFNQNQNQNGLFSNQFTNPPDNQILEKYQFQFNTGLFPGGQFGNNNHQGATSGVGHGDVQFQGVFGSGSHSGQNLDYYHYQYSSGGGGDGGSDSDFNFSGSGRFTNKGLFH